MVLESWMFLHGMIETVDNLELKKIPYNRILVLKQYLAESQSLGPPINSWVIFIELGKT
jgi:hypothetical protein